jgi:hypothetical protein
MTKNPHGRTSGSSSYYRLSSTVMKIIKIERMVESMELARTPETP